MWQIQFYEDHRGKSPALDYINNLPLRDKAKVYNVLRLLEEFGIALTMPHTRRMRAVYGNFVLATTVFFIFYTVNTYANNDVEEGSKTG